MTATTLDAERHAIATLGEGPLHAGLKAWYAAPGDQVEVPLEGMQIDLVRGTQLIEIQTASFSSFKRKLSRLIEAHDVRVVHPVAHEKWILRVADEDDDSVAPTSGADRFEAPAGMKPLGRKKSQRRGRVEELFEELVRLAPFLDNPRLTFEVLLTQEEEVRRFEFGRARRRKGWVIVERRLIDVVDRTVFASPDDWRRLFPAVLPSPFDTGELGIGRDLAQKMVYCLSRTEMLEQHGKCGNAKTWTLT